MDDYKLYLEGQKLAPTTIHNHIRNLTKYETDGFDKDDEDEDNTIKNLKTYSEGSRLQTMTATLSKYRTYKQYSNENVRGLLVNAVELTKQQNQQTNQSKTIPSIQSFKKLMKDYKDKKDYSSAVILYLLISYNVRNADLILDIVDKKPIDTTKNYLYIKSKSVEYIRNDYKTAKTYGPKKHIIKSPFVLESVKELQQLGKTLINGDNDNITRVIKKISGGYTEADIMKQSVFEAKGIKQLTKISDNRGTSLKTMSESYDIEA